MASVATASSDMLVCKAEQLEFLVHGLRFAQFYFQTISLPHLGNRNQSMPEPWRRARHPMYRSVKRHTLHDNGVPPYLQFML